MTNRDFLKQLSTEEIPDAETVLAGAAKPRRSWKRVAVAAAVAVAIGMVGTAAAYELGIITIGPAAERMVNMTPEEYEDAHTNPPEFNIDDEIAAMEDYVETLNIITDPDELQQGVEYNVLGIATVGVWPTYAFCEYDPELWDLCWSPEVSSSINPLKCLPGCNSDKFYFVCKSGGSSFEEDGKLYSWDSSAVLKCAECGMLHNYRLGEVTESKYEAPELPEDAVYLTGEPVQNEDGSYSFRLELTDEPPTPIEANMSVDEYFATATPDN